MVKVTLLSLLKEYPDDPVIKRDLRKGIVLYDTRELQTSFMFIDVEGFMMPMDTDEAHILRLIQDLG